MKRFIRHTSSNDVNTSLRLEAGYRESLQKSDMLIDGQYLADFLSRLPHGTIVAALKIMKERYPHERYADIDAVFSKFFDC